MRHCCLRTSYGLCWNDFAHVRASLSRDQKAVCVAGSLDCDARSAIGQPKASSWSIASLIRTETTRDRATRNRSILLQSFRLVRRKNRGISWATRSCRVVSRSRIEARPRDRATKNGERAFAAGSVGSMPVRQQKTIKLIAGTNLPSFIRLLWPRQVGRLLALPERVICSRTVVTILF
jgi:hypothetical protein